MPLGYGKGAKMYFEVASFIFKLGMINYHATTCGRILKHNTIDLESRLLLDKEEEHNISQLLAEQAITSSK